MAKKIYVNLPVKNLRKTKAFFAKLGFKFNPRFTDKNAACMIVSKDIFVMLLVEKFFNHFTKRKSVNAKKSTEVILSLAVASKGKADQMLLKAVKAGGKETRKAEDYGWMYGRSFEDLDGHHWEVFHMNTRAMPKK
jgi:predicted lactoylglutathione lyase